MEISVWREKRESKATTKATFMDEKKWEEPFRRSAKIKYIIVLSECNEMSG